jgi:hypothetical protein
MAQVWTQSADDVNIAPPVRPAVHAGWTAVKKNYDGYWGSLAELTVSMREPAITIKGSVAWVYGVEQSTRRTRNGETSGGPNFGTSIFVNQGGRWRMVFHQSALIPQQQ